MAHYLEPLLINFSHCKPFSFQNSLAFKWLYFLDKVPLHSTLQNILKTLFFSVVLRQEYHKPHPNMLNQNLHFKKKISKWLLFTLNYTTIIFIYYFISGFLLVLILSHNLETMAVDFPVVFSVVRQAVFFSFFLKEPVLKRL